MITEILEYPKKIKSRSVDINRHSERRFTYGK